MTSTLFKSAALDHFIAQWATKIVEFLIAIVETILTIEINARPIWHELAAGCREDRAAALTVVLGAFLPDDGEGWRASSAGCVLLPIQGVDVDRGQPQAWKNLKRGKQATKLSARKLFTGYADLCREVRSIKMP